jgi:putative membrane protein
VTVFALARAEFARLTASKIGIISLLALMIVPIIYGGLYLWGNNDPYNNLNKVPAAIVVTDRGASVGGKTVNYGRTAANSLIAGKRFGWHEVSASAASAGVRSGKYDFALSFPAGFSSNLVSASSTMPVSAQLNLTTDDTNSYLSTTLAKQAAEAVRVAVTREVSQTASGTLLSSISSIRSGLVNASSGASTLSDASAQATTGAATLRSGASTLAAGASTLSSGLARLDTAAQGLPSSTSTLSTGAATVASGLAAASTASATLATASGQAAALSAAVSEEISGSLLQSNLSPELQSQLTSQLGQLSALTAAVSSGAAQLSPNLAKLSTGASRVAAGSSALTSAAGSLSSSIHDASVGAANVSSGAAQVSGGTATLGAGINQISAGAKTLATSLKQGAQSLPDTTDANRATTAKLLASPLTVKQDAVTVAQNYGAGLAPFFLSLAAWIGMYALFLLLRPLSRRALTAVRRPIRITLAGWAVPAILGVVQMVALFVIVTTVLHLHVANPIGLLAFLAFVSITFAAIVLALNVLLGSVGQFLALVFMVVQLVTAGGTFPWQTLPGPLAALHEALPMSHAVDGVRQLMYGGATADIWGAVLPLALWLVGSLIATVLGARRQGKYRTLRELRPSPIGA